MAADGTDGRVWPWMRPIRVLAMLLAGTGAVGAVGAQEGVTMAKDRAGLSCRDVSFSPVVAGDGPAINRYRVAGEPHRAFADLLGEWDVEMITRDASGEVTASSNDIRATKTLFADGRYVREDVSGTIGGGRHEKLAVLGFNNIRHRYEYSTADNYDAVILLYTSAPGAALDACRIETFADYVYAGDGEAPSGTVVTIRTVIEIENEDRHVLRNYYGAPGAEEYMFLEYVYTKRPS